MSSTLTSSAQIARIREAWRTNIAGAPLVGTLALLILGACVTAQLARGGTAPARIIAGGSFLALVALVSWRAIRSRRSLTDLDTTLRRIVGASEPEVAARALRAARLVREMDGTGSGASPALAAEHFERIVRSASIRAVEAAASDRARRWRGAGLVAALTAVFSTVVEPARVFEGIDVLFAQGGVAPWAIPWLGDATVEARQPSYLRVHGHSLGFDSVALLPVGTEIVVRGRAYHAGRKLVLTDGHSEVPFTDDGHGLFVARWTLKQNSGLGVAARFGDVVIRDPSLLDARALVDQAPNVVLKDAPRVVRIAELTRLDLEWTALDDHGLRQVDLVLRSGEREVRRTLGHFDGETVNEGGGHALTPRDEFLRGAYLPVEISIEARDNDPLSSEKWGRSAILTAIPPAVGEAEALRYRALLDSRADLTRLLELQLARERAVATPELGSEVRAQPLAPALAPSGTDAAAEHARLDGEISAARTRVLGLEGKLQQTYGGLGASRGLQNFVAAILESMRAPAKDARARIAETEEVLLALDSALQSLGQRDAADVSKRLGDVAESAAHASHLARETEKRGLGLTRLDQALDALEAGAKELSVLGALGRDLGSVAVAGLDRIRRVRRLDDLFHTEQAALFLAARLRRPNPSFASSGGGGGGGGVESGPGSQGGGGGDSASDADSEFDEVADQLQQLAEEHAGQLEQVEQALREAEQGVTTEADQDEARRRADETRRAVGDLPRPGEDPGTARAAAALAREHSMAMAESMEKLEFREAVESGERALESIDNALKAVDATSDLDIDELNEARRVVAEHLAWSKAELQKLRAAAEAQAKDALRQLGEGEGELSKRAAQLLEQGGKGALLPDEALKLLEQAKGLMREAAEALGQGQGERGERLQEQAQRLLEQANLGKTTDPNAGDDPGAPKRGDRAGNGKPGVGGEVPDQDARNRAEEFRKRVVEGLGKTTGGKLAPAIRKYAEGLLQ